MNIVYGGWILEHFSQALKHSILPNNYEQAHQIVINIQKVFK